MKKQMPESPVIYIAYVDFDGKEDEAVLKSFSPFAVLLCNIALVAGWHVVVFILCVRLPRDVFDSQRKRYQAKHWEKGGRWYKDHLKIQLWKDKVPQFVAKDGFSKSHITDLSLEYLDEFIMETCRGEWMHLANCLCALVLIVINAFPLGLIFGILVVLGNLPFALIQRYNRFRLDTVRRKKIRDLQHAATISQGQEPSRVSS